MSNTPVNDQPFVMFEEDWIALCKRQCAARRKEWGEDECVEHDGMCGECVRDAALRVPKKYRTTREIAEAHDPLPGTSAFF